MSSPTTIQYLDSLPLPLALWWFIENVSIDDPEREDLFFKLRERVRVSPSLQVPGTVVRLAGANRQG